jgi:small-conductance mechanosensitive channel
MTFLLNLLFGRWDGTTTINKVVAKFDALNAQLERGIALVNEQLTANAIEVEDAQADFEALRDALFAENDALLATRSRAAALTRNLQRLTAE